MTQSEKGLSREPLTLKLRTEQPIKQLRALSEFNCYVERAVKIFIRTEIYLASGRVLKCCEKNVQKYAFLHHDRVQGNSVLYAGVLLSNSLAVD